MENWKKKTFIMGGLLGLLAGIIASYIMVQQSEKKHTALALNASDGVKLGLGLLTFLRQIADVSSKE